MVGRDLSLEDLNMDLVDPDMKGLGLEEETLQQNVIHREPRRGIHLI